MRTQRRSIEFNLDSRETNRNIRCLAYFYMATIAESVPRRGQKCRNPLISFPLQNAAVAPEPTKTHKIGRSARIQKDQAIRLRGKNNPPASEVVAAGCSWSLLTLRLVVIVRILTLRLVRHLYRNWGSPLKLRNRMAYGPCLAKGRPISIHLRAHPALSM